MASALALVLLLMLLPSQGLHAKLSRRTVSVAAPALATALLGLRPVAADEGEGGLAARLRARDAALLGKPIFNLPPRAQAFPAWLEGEWAAVTSFAGFELPSAKLAKNEVLGDLDVPGFQKASIAPFADVGSSNIAHRQRFARAAPGGPVLEDKVFNLGGAIDAHLGYAAVEEVVLPDGPGNPNRVSVVFKRGKTRNAERIELFYNARQSDASAGGGDGGAPERFFCSEYARQLTFSASATPGVARQVAGDFQVFSTYTRRGEGQVRCNTLTAAYLQPQDALYFKEPTLPVIVYSHVTDMTLETAAA